MVKISKGKKPVEIREVALPGDRRLLQIEDLRDGAIPRYCPAARNEVVADEDDLVLAWDGANAGISSHGLKGAAGSTLAVLRPLLPAQVHTPYLAQFLKSKQGYLRSTCKGATVPHIDPAAIAGLEVELPALPEQCRIAAILDQAEKQRGKAETALVLVESMRMSIAQSFFDAHKTFPMVALAELAERVVVGYVGPSSSHIVDDGVPFLRTGNIGPGEIIEKDLLQIDHKLHGELKKSQLHAGDVVLRRHIDDRIRSAIIPAHLDGSNCANIIVVRPSERVRAEIVTSYLGLAETQQFLVGRRVGSAQSVVNTTELKKLPVPDLPTDVQVRYCEIVRDVRRNRDRIARLCLQLGQLFTSLQSRAFSGQL